MSTSPKEIIFEEEARELLATGIKKLADVVAFTLGPQGRNVGLEKSWGSPDITSDGGKIATEINLENQYEEMGASIAKEVVQKLKEKCGDGTTTATVILRAMVDNGIKQIASGASPIGIKRGIDKAVEAITEELKKQSHPIKDQKEIESLATVSATGDKEIGKIIAEAMARGGVITVEESKSTETTTEWVEGMQFDRGYISPYFCTNADKMLVELVKPKILICDKKISNIHELLPILQRIAATGQPLLIIAEDIEGDVLSTLVINKIRGSLKVAAVKAPGFGDRRKAMLEDIAVLTGATVISEEKGIKLQEAEDSVLGSAENVTISKEKTVLVHGAGSEEAIKARIDMIENELKLSTNKYDSEKLEERIAKLKGGVVVIKVGALTEPDSKYRKARFDNSLNSTLAAKEEGVVTGGGVALLRSCEAIKKLKLTGDEEVGAQIVYQACQAPIRQIASNCGLDGQVILAEVRNATGNTGFNAANGKIEDLMKAGVIDPVKVVRNSLQHAASAAGIVLLSEALIGNAPEDDEQK